MLEQKGYACRSISNKGCQEIVNFVVAWPHGTIGSSTYWSWEVANQGWQKLATSITI